MFAARELHPARVAAGAEDELLAPQLLPTIQRERVLVYEPGLARALDDPHSRRLQTGLELLFLLDLVDDALGAVQKPGEVHAGRFADQAVVGELPGVTREAGGVGQHAGRDAAVVGARATHVPALDQGDR